MKKLLLLTIALVGLNAALASAQGVQTGTLRGTVRDAQDLAAPGVTVLVTSPSLQGERLETTDINGQYVVRGLPPGEYTIKFSLSGMRDAQEITTIPLGGTTEVDTKLTPAGVAEDVTVVADITPTALATVQVGANYKKEELDFLPMRRTLVGIAALSPGLTENTPNTGQVTIAGSFAYDNVFLVDGVDVNDNLFGSANNLFIEDAVEEMQILTSAVPAEYGRFSGGVINTITKRGGNVFSGSFRSNFTNDDWFKRTPFEVTNNRTRTDKVNKTYEATFGGPIVRDALWFFTAGRWENRDSAVTLPQTSLQYNQTRENRRGEVKVTGTLAQNHTLQGLYLRNSSNETRVPFGFTIDPVAIEHPDFPNDQFVMNYRGVLSTKLFGELQYSQKDFGFRGAGGTATNIVDSPIITLSLPTGHYNGNYFDATDPEDRNNRQVAGSLSYFASTPNWGRHDIKGGGEWFRSNRTGGNSQSSTGYVFDADYLKNADGTPVIGSDGRLIPVFVPGETLIENWLPTRGAVLDIRTISLYLQDRWAANPNLTLDLGFRFEKVDSEATGGIVGVDTSAFVPRLGATYDIKGNGKYVAQATYGHYAGKYSESQFGNNTSVGSPDEIIGIYDGPAGQGRSFAPGFNPANYEPVEGEFPTANVFFEDGLSSPITREWTLQLGGELWRNGYAKFSYVNRHMYNFVEDFITLDTGETEVVRDGVDFGTFSNIVYANSDLPKRDYQAIVLQARQRLSSRWLVEGHWTIQLENDGSFEGEAANQPGISSIIGDYPEIYSPARHFPDGRIDDYQKHRVNLWSTYNFGFGHFGNVGVSGILRLNSAQTFSLRSANRALSATQVALASAYASLPSSQTIYFADRGSEEFKGYGVFDMAVNYDVPVFKTVRPWIKLEVYNLFNNQKLINWNTTVTPDAASPLDNLGLRTGFVRGANFGNAQANTDFPVPFRGQTGGRGFQLAAGIRF